MSSNKRSRGWCFTLQSWDPEDCARAMSLYEFDYNCSYLIVGFEVSPRTSHEHLQCYVYYTNPVRFSEMKNRLVSVHIEPQKAKLNVVSYCYCMEDHDYYEVGQRPRQGHRTDLEVIKHDLMTKKKTIKEVSVDYFAQYCQYSRQFNSFIEINSLVPKYDTMVMVYDEDTVKKVYTYDTTVSWIYDNNFYLEMELLHKYYSRRYKYIFVPNRPGVERLEKFNLNIEVI